MMNKRYIVFYTLLGILIIGSEAVTAQTDAVNRFAVRTLCGPIWAWVLALLAPIESLQQAIRTYLPKNGQSQSDG